jgi:hypothetical protein
VGSQSKSVINAWPISASDLHCSMHSACLKGANSGHSGCAAYCEPSDASNIVQLTNRKRLSSSDLAN